MEPTDEGEVLVSPDADWPLSYMPEGAVFRWRADGTGSIRPYHPASPPVATIQINGDTLAPITLPAAGEVAWVPVMVVDRDNGLVRALTEAEMDLIQAATMDPKHDHLNALLDEDDDGAAVMRAMDRMR